MYVLYFLFMEDMKGQEKFKYKMMKFNKSVLCLMIYVIKKCKEF